MHRGADRPIRVDTLSDKWAVEIDRLRQELKATRGSARYELRNRNVKDILNGIVNDCVMT